MVFLGRSSNSSSSHIFSPYVFEAKVLVIFWEAWIMKQRMHYPHALPFKLKKNFRAFLTFSEKILPEKNVPTTFLFISPSVG